ncbi:MAG TPA: class I SAM-dependent methyltransferase, partial [Thermoanaerobaculia bacterium]|nr:class I SAM-dependent methyltransferase [Thermoanaerobaculia bacterium]
MRTPEFYDGCAAFYDADYEAAGYDEDVPFYVELARESGGPVLEMGCGTGRVLLAVAQAGIEIAGIDGSARMLDRLKAHLAEEPEAVRRRVRLLHGDIRTARVEGDFALVTAPFRVVQHLV